MTTRCTVRVSLLAALIRLQLFLIVVKNNHASAVGGDRTEFQYVLEKVSNFMNPPIFALDIMKQLHQIEAFPHRLEAPDRDKALEYMYSIITAQNENGVKVYYGMESGLFLGYTASQYERVPTLSYREPGESGYDATKDKEMDKYWDICVNRETGASETCQMGEGDGYISCVDNCNAIVTCPNSESQRNCSSLPTNSQERLDCERNIKWCYDYSIETFDGNINSSTGIGYVPRTYSCIDSQGRFSDVPGEVLVEVFNEDTNSVSVELGNCTFEDGAMVTKRISGPYAYCGGNHVNGNFPNCTTFTGVYRNSNYDPRLRGWYIDVKEVQRSRWSDPYLFFTTGDVGITYAIPLYSTDKQGRNVFAGVLAADYLLTDISSFLVKVYSKTDIIVAIYEDAQPHNLIGLSTGSNISQRVSTRDPSQPCFFADECKVVRLPITELNGKEEDVLIKNSHLTFVDEGYDFNLGQTIGIRSFSEDMTSSNAYSALSLIYEQLDSNLKWRIVILRRMPRDPENSINKDDPLFIVVCLISSCGFLLCAILLGIFYHNRKQAAVKYADIRLTSAFILMCALLNLTDIAFLGENTDELCLFRMWVLYMVVAGGLSPLFVKAYRTWMLLGDTILSGKKKMNNYQAMLRTLPLPILQMCILLIFTFVDPPKSVENIDTNTLIPIQQISCDSESKAFVIIEAVFHMILITVGCVLSYKTRAVSSKISDSKPLLFAMYNIAFSLIMVASIVSAVDLSEQGQVVIQAVGIFWATVFSSAAFVIPRLLKAKNVQKEKELRLTQARLCLHSKQQKYRRKQTDWRKDSLCADNIDEMEDTSLNILVCSGNLGNAKPTHASMEAWIPSEGMCDIVTPLEGKSFHASRFDIVVIGMQESTWSSAKKNRVDESVIFHISGHSSEGGNRKQAFDEDEDDAEMNYLAAVEGEDSVTLRKMIRDVLGEGYTSIAEEFRGQMRLYIYAFNEVAPFIEDVKVSGANTGVGNVLANKGGIIVSLNFMETKFSFLSAHLAAHEGQSHYQARCSNIHDILKSSVTTSFGQSCLSSHHMFVLGDLNFRTSFGDDDTTHKDNVERAIKLISDKDFATLYSFDELHKGIASGDLLAEFQTVPCNFNPTFKVERGPGFVYKQQRTPSYTDRILFKSNVGLASKLKAIAYEPCVDFTTSDHKPIRGAFSIVPNEIIKPIKVQGKLLFRFHEMSCSDVHAGDVDGFSDPYIKFVWDGVDMTHHRKLGFKHSSPMTFGNLRWPRTSYKRKTLNPNWKGEEILLVLNGDTVPAHAMLFLVVMDYDFAKKDNWLATLPLNIKDLVLMMHGEKKRKISFDRPLPRYGTYAGSIKFMVDISISEGSSLLEVIF